MEEINIKEFFGYLLKNIVVIALVSLSLAFVTLIYSKYIKVPMYKTSSTLVLTKSNNIDQNTTITQNDVILNQKLVLTYSELVKSKRVLNQVIKDLNLDYKVSDLAKLINV